MARAPFGPGPAPMGSVPAPIGSAPAPIWSGLPPVGSKPALALHPSVVSAAAPVGSKRAAVFRGGIRASEAAASVLCRVILCSNHPLTPSFERRGTSLTPLLSEEG